MNTHAASAAGRMRVYALVLVVLGLVGYGLAWSEAKAPPSPTPAEAEVEAAVDGAATEAPAAAPSITPLIFTFGPALLMVVMSWMTSRIDRSKALGMIGIHLGMLLPFVFAIAYAVVGWGRLGKWQAGEKPLSAVVLFAVMVVASLAAGIAVLQTRPSKSERGG